jgi:hypothetical protein
MSFTDVFLSPHQDDVCFSLAATALARRGGQLVNIYTQSEYSIAPVPVFENREARITYITNMRTEEDRKFAAAGNLVRHDLMFKEPGLSGIHPLDVTDIQVDIDCLSGVLVDFLIGLHQPDGINKPSLFCPMGIGGHRNHLAVLGVIAKALPRLRRLYDMYFYEDLYYASDQSARNEGLSRATAILNGERLARIVTPLSPEDFARKMSLVGTYSSQHRGQPQPSYFVPAAPDAGGPHEAFWSLSPSSASSCLE